MFPRGGLRKAFNRISALTTWCRNLSGITVRDRKGDVVAKTRMTIPTSDGINVRSATAPPRSGTRLQNTTDNRTGG